MDEERYIPRKTSWFMKHLPAYHDFLNEIRFGSAQPYEWEDTEYEVDEEVRDIYSQYHFKTDSGMSYRVVLAEMTDSVWELAFDAIDTATNKRYASAKDMAANTNRGEQYRVLATVKEIVTDFIEKNGWKVSKIEVTGSKAPDEKGEVSQRTRFYHMALQQLYPADLIEFDGEHLYIKVPPTHIAPNQ